MKNEIDCFKISSWVDNCVELDGVQNLTLMDIEYSRFDSLFFHHWLSKFRKICFNIAAAINSKIIININFLKNSTKITDASVINVDKFKISSHLEHIQKGFFSTFISRFHIFQASTFIFIIAQSRISRRRKKNCCYESNELHKFFYCIFPSF